MLPLLERAHERMTRRVPASIVSDIPSACLYQSSFHMAPSSSWAAKL